jgi:DUF1680 family protein
VRQYPPGQVRLLPTLGRIDYADQVSPFAHRVSLVRGYLMSLAPENLLRPFRFEAGIAAPSAGAGHGGWEALESQLRGHFLGHWLSAASRLGDIELRARATTIVEGLAECQRENGGEWVFSIPEKYLHRTSPSGRRTTPSTRR